MPTSDSSASLMPTSQLVAGEGPGPPSSRVMLNLSTTRRKRRFRGWLQATHHMVTAHPMVFVTPLLMLAAMLAASIVGVLHLSAAIQTQRQEDATNEAVARGMVIAEKLLLGSIPVHALSNLVKSTPNHSWPTIAQLFNSTAQSVVDLLSGSGLDSKFLAISPAGIVHMILPLEPNLSTLYVDLLADAVQRNSSLTAIKQGSLVLIGPYLMYNSYIGMAIRQPVFVDGSYGPNETFGLPLSPRAPFGNTPYNCPECYGAQRFWGFCHSIISWDVLRKFSRVDDLYDKSGYLFQLTRPPMSTETQDYVLAAAPGVGNDTMPDAVAVRFPVLNTEWTLLLSRPGGWYPSWRTPMLVVVVIVSLIVSLLIGLVMGWNCRLSSTTSRLQVAAGKLQKEKERMDVLLVRQYELIHCFANEKGPGDGSAELGGRIDRLRDSLQTHRRVSTSMRRLQGDKIDLHELLGSGNFGKVYRGTWRGTTVAVKCIVLPSSMSRSAHAERMALMETAISSSMHHPHLVQTYTYSIKPIKDSAQTEDSALLLLGPASLSETVTGACVPYTPKHNGMDDDSKSSGPFCDNAKDTHSFEIQLVLEYCDGGSLEEVLRCGGFLSGNGLNFGGILDTAADVAKGMLHLHINEILHSDLKAGNVMFKAGGHDGRGVIAKVVDFGLSIQLDVSGNQTHVSKMFQGTLTHMAPEVLLIGKQSKAGDVYAFGILMFELYTGTRPYIGIASALLGHHVAREGRRPQFTSFTPKAYRDLAERCWQANPDLRPTFEQILEELQSMRAAYPASKPLNLPSHSRTGFKSMHVPALRQCELPTRRPQASGRGPAAPSTPSAAAAAAATGLEAAPGAADGSTMAPAASSPELPVPACMASILEQAEGAVGGAAAGPGAGAEAGAAAGRPLADGSVAAAAAAPAPASFELHASSAGYSNGCPLSA